MLMENLLISAAELICQNTTFTYLLITYLLTTIDIKFYIVNALMSMVNSSGVWGDVMKGVLGGLAPPGETLNPPFPTKCCVLRHNLFPGLIPMHFKNPPGTILVRILSLDIICYTLICSSEKGSFSQVKCAAEKYVVLHQVTITQCQIFRITLDSGISCLFNLPLRFQTWECGGHEVLLFTVFSLIYCELL